VSAFGPYLAFLYELQVTRHLVEWAPAVDTLSRMLNEAAPLLVDLEASEARRQVLLNEYEQLRPKGPRDLKPREMLAVHSRLRLKLISYVACEEREAEILRQLAHRLTPFVELAPDLYRGPLREYFLPLVPIIPPFLNTEQRRALADKCPHVTWADPRQTPTH
jgi:hypothetical protein